jgi:hypothetical protein
MLAGVDIKAVLLERLTPLAIGLVFIVGMILLCMRCICSSGDGIITLEGYEHGVVICGEGMTINHGHYQDPEVQQLIKLAREKCP